MSTVKANFINPNLAGSFSGISGFLRNRLKFKDKQAVVKELRKLNTYQLHKDVRRKFKRRHVKVFWKDNTWSSDLKDISNVADYNNCNTFILICICNFSKKAYTRMIRDKTAQSMIKAFRSIFKESGTKPLYIASDQGKEYTCKEVTQFLKENGISLYHTTTPIKATFAENFIKNLFAKISRYMTEKQTLKFDDKLQAFTHSYNNTIHSKIKRTPNSITEANQMDVWRDIYMNDYKEKEKRKNKFKVGDLIKISNEKLRFEKGYTARWSNENFKVSKVLPTNPTTYFLQDLKGEDINGSLYTEELQLVE